MKIIYLFILILFFCTSKPSGALHYVTQLLNLLPVNSTLTELKFACKETGEMKETPDLKQSTTNICVAKAFWVNTNLVQGIQGSNATEPFHVTGVKNL